MKIKLIKGTVEYSEMIVDMLDEWHSTGEEIIPFAIRGNYDDFESYLETLEVTDTSTGKVPDSTYFCLDTEREVIVGAVNIRHYLNEALLRTAGHVGLGVRPTERRKGYATEIIRLALLECKELGIVNVLMTCDKENIGSAKSIINNGGILENEVKLESGLRQRYWIDNN